MKTLLLCSLLIQTALASYINKDISGTEYFRLFDYNQATNQEAAFELEEKLVKHSRNIVKYLDQFPDYKANSKKETSRNKLAMILVYTGMLLMNNNNGVIEGVIPTEVFLSQSKLSKKRNVREEIIARYELSEFFLQYARKVEPEDIRIMAWHSSNTLRLEKFRDGVVSEKVLDWIMQMTISYPIFHLFNALTMSSDYYFGDEREKALLKTVELMNSKDSPCFPPIKFLRRGEAKKCNTTKKTPFAMQGTSVYMGDMYLKEVVRNKDLTNVDREKYLKRALSTYRRPRTFKPIKTSFWKLKNNLKKRIDIVKGMRKGESLSEDFFKTREFLDIYTCTSCHQGGKAKRALHVNLP